MGGNFVQWSAVLHVMSSNCHQNLFNYLGVSTKRLKMPKVFNIYFLYAQNPYHQTLHSKCIKNWIQAHQRKGKRAEEKNKNCKCCNVDLIIKVTLWEWINYHIISYYTYAWYSLICLNDEWKKQKRLLNLNWNNDSPFVQHQ